MEAEDCLPGNEELFGRLKVREDQTANGSVILQRLLEDTERGDDDGCFFFLFASDWPSQGSRNLFLVGQRKTPQVMLFSESPRAAGGKVRRSVFVFLGNKRCP